MPLTVMPELSSRRPLPSWALGLARRFRERRLTPIDRLWQDRLQIFRAAGLEPYQWQQQILESKRDRILVLCARQTGKSMACSALALWTMLVKPPALVLVVSPSDRQSGQFVRKAKTFFNALRLPGLPEVTANSKLELGLDNGSQLVGLPDSEGTVRCFSSVNLLFFEEASRIPGPLFQACTPMLAASGGRRIALSTAFGKQGWFFEAWDHEPNWQRFNITADQCPHITAEFLEEERKSMPERWYLQEYFNAFLDPIDSVFRWEDIQAMEDPDAKPLVKW